MAANESILSLIIKAVDDASATMAKVAGGVDALGASATKAAAQTDTLGSSMTKAGSSISSLGTKLVPVSLAAAGAIGLATKAAMDFSQTMELLHTQAGLSQDAVDGLKDKVLALAPIVGQGPDALATAFYHIASAGNGIWDTAKMLDILKIAAEGAAIGQASLDDTTYALTSAMASGVKGAKDASEMMSVLNAVVGAGDMHMQDLNGAIGTGFLSTAAAFGISVQSVGTALATLTDNGEHADAAATRLRMTWALMGSPSGEATKQLSALGLTTSEVSTATGTMNAVFAQSGLTTTKLADDLRQPNGMTVAIKDLQTHLQNAGLTASQTDAMLAKAFGGGRTDAALLTLLQNIDRMDSKFQIINSQTSQFANDWASQQDQAAQKWKDFEAEVGVLAVKFGNDFLPALLSIAKTLGGVADYFSNLSDSSRQAIVDIVLFTAALAPLLIITGRVVSAVGMLVKLGEGLGALRGIGTALGAVGGGADAAAGIGAVGGGLAAAVPFAIALAPILAVVGLRLHDEAQSADEVAKATANATDEINKNGASQSLVKIFTEAHTTAVKNQKQATTELKTAQEAIQPSNANLLKTQTELKTAQDNVTKALQTYGQNSPQYQQAVDQLTQKQLQYRDAVHDASSKTLDLMGAQGKLRDANNALKDATKTLNDYLKEQNKDLGDITNTIHNFGPAADLQVKSIANLGQNIANVVAQFKNAQGLLQAGIASDIGNFQGLGSTIDRLQKTANNLQSTTSGIKIQGGSPSSMQGNYGTAPVPGVYQAHADGGVFSSPHYGLVGESGPEAVIPLNNPARASQVMKEAGLGGGGGLTINNPQFIVKGNFMGTSAEARQFAAQIWQQLMSIAKSNGAGGNLPSIGVRPL